MTDREVSKRAEIAGLDSTAADECICGRLTSPPSRLATGGPGKQPSGLERLLTTREVAGLLQLNPKTVERRARDGRLPSLRVAGRLRFKPSDIASWLAAREDRACHGS